MPECRSTVSGVVFDLVRGKSRVNLAPIAGCYGDAGSNNWPWGAALADFIANGNPSKLLVLLHQQLDEGMRRTEFGAELYDPDVLAYWVVALGRARVAGEGELARLLAQALAAYLAYLAITAMLGARTKTTLISPEGTATTAGDAKFYSGGVSVCTPGHRFNPSVVAQGMLGPILAWALGYPAHYRRTIAQNNYTWPLMLLELGLSGGRSGGLIFGDPTDAAVWGLTDIDRIVLRALIEHDSPGGLPHALGMLSAFHLFGPLRIIVEATSGGRTAWLQNGVSGLKPTLAACSLDCAGSYRAVVPSPWSRLRALPTTTVEHAAEIECDAGSGSFMLVKCPGTVLWRFTWDAEGGARSAGALPPPAPRPPPTPPPPPQSAPEARTTIGGRESARRAACPRDRASGDRRRAAAEG